MLNSEETNLAMNTVDRTEMIDAYLAGTMSEEEKNEFERLLLDSDSSLKDRTNLRNEMELQKEIILAIRRRAFREMLAEEEARIKQEKEDADRAAAASRISWPKHIVRAVSSVAVAACFCGVFIAPQVSRLASISNDAELYAAVSMDMNEAYSGLKGCNEASNAIIDAAALMQSGDYKQADALLADALRSMPEVTNADSQAWSEKEDMLYLRALCVIKQHKLYRSRRLLNEVVRMDGLHRDQASELLNTIKHGR